MSDSKPKNTEVRNGLVISFDNPPVMTEEQAHQFEAKRRAELVIKPEERMSLEELRQRMAEKKAEASRPDSVEYQHSLLCALTLPRSRQEGREYVREYQGRSLKLEAGELYDGTRWIAQPLPMGRRPDWPSCTFAARP